MKTCRKFVFHRRETHISSLFDIKVLYMIFWVFFQNIKFLLQTRGQPSVLPHEAHIIFLLDISMV
jgi:hypothetical protein